MVARRRLVMCIRTERYSGLNHVQCLYLMRFHPYLPSVAREFVGLEPGPGHTWLMGGSSWKHKLVPVPTTSDNRPLSFPAPIHTNELQSTGNDREMSSQ
jgi:hypothetical protein